MIFEKASWTSSYVLAHLVEQDGRAYYADPDILSLPCPPPPPLPNENFSWATWTADLTNMVWPSPSKNENFSWTWTTWTSDLARMSPPPPSIETSHGQLGLQTWDGLLLRGHLEPYTWSSSFCVHIALPHKIFVIPFHKTSPVFIVIIWLTSSLSGDCDTTVLLKILAYFLWCFSPWAEAQVFLIKLSRFLMMPSPAPRGG